MKSHIWSFLCILLVCETQIYVGPNSGIGSGSLSDPFRDFNPAFAVLTQGNNQISVLPGTYDISSPFQIPINFSFSVTGTSSYNTIIRYAPNSYTFNYLATLTNSIGSTWSDLTFSGCVSFRIFPLCFFLFDN
jgi:hypothetical protein